MNWQWVYIHSGNGLVLNRRQAIIWTTNGLVYWRMNESQLVNKLRPVHRPPWVKPICIFNDFSDQLKMTDSKGQFQMDIIDSLPAWLIDWLYLPYNLTHCGLSIP